jgi:hypothetical protein
MAKKRIPSEHLRRKVLLLCEDANALADDIKHLAILPTMNIKPGSWQPGLARLR